MFSFRQIRQLRDSGIGHFMLDSLFSCDQELIEARQAYAAVLAGADPLTQQAQLAQRWPAMNYGSGYYELKTNLTKEDAA